MEKPFYREYWYFPQGYIQLKSEIETPILIILLYEKIKNLLTKY